MKGNFISFILILLGFFLLFGNLRINTALESVNIMIIFPLIMIGLFIFIIAIVLKADKAAKYNRENNRNNPRPRYQNGPFETKADQITHCEFCNAEMKKSDRFCSKCGEPAKGYVRCGYCGHLNPDTNDLCEKCNGFL